MPVAPLRSKYVGSSNRLESEEDRDMASDLLASRSFYFAERYKEIDMAAIDAVDLERIQRDVDIEALQQNLEMLTYGDMSKSQCKPLGLGPKDAAFLKVFRLAQLTIEYLLNVQDVLAEGLEKSANKAKAAQQRCEKYRFKAKEYEARIKALKGDVKAKRGAIHTYEALVSNARTNKSRRSRGESVYEEDDDSVRDGGVFDDEEDDLRRSLKSARAEMTLFLSTPTGACSRYNVKLDTTAAELCARLREGPRVRLLHKGVELAQDAVLSNAGVRHGDTLVVLKGAGGGNGAGGWDPHASETELLDRRIAELEASIRSEMAVQLQTQLAGMRHGVSGFGSTAGCPETSKWGSDPRCYAGPLEDDEDDEFATPHHHRGQGVDNSGAIDEIRASEARLRAQMDALESRMLGLVDRLGPGVSPASARTLDTAATLPLPDRAAKTPSSPPKPGSPLSQRSVSTLHSPRDAASLGPWTLRATIGDDGDLELDVAADDTVAVVKAAVAAELDLEMDRVVFVRASTGAVLAQMAELRAASTDGDCACDVIRGDAVSAANTADAVALHRALKKAAPVVPHDAAKAAALDKAVGDRQTAWREVAESQGVAQPLSQADVARMQVRVAALAKLVDAVENLPGLDHDMVDKLKTDLATVCEGLPPAVADAIKRVQRAVDTRASLLAARQQAAAASASSS